MTKCTFCGKDEKPFKGIHLIRNTGTISYFCSSKCRKNSEKLKRDKRKLKWTEAFHIARDKGRAKEKLAEEVKEEKKVVNKINKTKNE